MSYFWTAQQDAQLRDGIAAGLTYQQVTDEMGNIYSRNAVIGRAKRLGLKSKSGSKFGPGNRFLTPEQLARKAERERQRYAEKVKPAREARVDKPKPVVRVVKPAPKIDAPEPRMVALVDLHARDCRWPIGDPKDSGFGFCGHQREQGEPYCGFHVKLAYAPRPLPVRRAAA